MLYFVLKYLHIIGACVLLGTGAGIAFFMLLAHLEGKPVVIAGVARIVVIADFLFTATAVRTHPVTSVVLPLAACYFLSERVVILVDVVFVVFCAFFFVVVFV